MTESVIGRADAAASKVPMRGPEQGVLGTLVIAQAAPQAKPQLFVVAGECQDGLGLVCVPCALWMGFVSTFGSTDWPAGTEIAWSKFLEFGQAIPYARILSAVPHRPSEVHRSVPGD
ncbi:hypothetical protein ACGFJT_41980 [Actinomadura geliboluensis]|uniref:hypothetical protein n=1 Tax=Actinomadura geliboluensis TaxID=882440 RepID=UPI003720577F